MKSIIAIFLVVFKVSVALHSKTFHFCYNKKSCGPENWPGQCQNRTSEAMQSPVNLQDLKPGSWSGSRESKSLRQRALMFSAGYGERRSFRLFNNGEDATIRFDRQESATLLNIAGDLTNGKTYTMAEVHFHWGANGSTGSEHRLNGQQYSLEMHYVHYRTDLRSFKSALKSKDRDALSVISVMFQEGRTENANLKPITDVLQHIKYKGDSRASSGLNLYSLFPRAYSATAAAAPIFNYYGSLTTPGCQQIVLWNVCKISAPVSNAQMQQFRAMTMITRDQRHLAEAPELIVDNFRPLQDLNGRAINVYNATFRRNPVTQNPHTPRQPPKQKFSFWAFLSQLFNKKKRFFFGL